MVPAYYPLQLSGRHFHSHKPLKVRQNVNNREFCFLGLLVGAFCFETVSYYVAQTSLNLDFPASASLALEKFCVPPPPPPRLTISHTMTFSSKAGIMTYGESHM